MVGSLSSGSRGPSPSTSSSTSSTILSARRGHGDALVFEQALDDAADLGAHPVLWNGRDTFQVQIADELAVNLRLQLEVTIGAARAAIVDKPPGRRWRPESRFLIGLTPVMCLL